MGALPASGQLQGAGGSPVRVTQLERDGLGPRLELPFSSLRLFLLLTSTNGVLLKRERERAVWLHVVEGAGVPDRNVSVPDPVTTGITILKIDSRCPPAGTG